MLIEINKGISNKYDEECDIYRDSTIKILHDYKEEK